MSKANGFIFREDTTRRALWLCLAAAVCLPAAAQFDPRQPYLTAAGKQELKPGASLTRWFEIEIRNTGAEAREAELLVFQCNGKDESASGRHRIEPGRTVNLPLAKETPCARQLRVSAAQAGAPSTQIFVVAALLQPAGAGLELSVKAQYLQGDNINLHSSTGQLSPPGRSGFRSFINFRSALLMNASAGDAMVRSCAAPSRDWIRFAKCDAGFAAAKLGPGGAMLVVDPNERCTLEFSSNDRKGLVHALGFEVSAGQTKHYEVNSSITFTEPKEQP